MAKTRLITSANEYARLSRRHIDGGDDFSHEANVAPEIWHEILDRFPELDQCFIDNDRLPDDVLVRLATWPDSSVRSQLTWRGTVPNEVLQLLVRDFVPYVRRSTALHWQTTVRQVVDLLAGDDAAGYDPDLRGILKQRFSIHWQDVAPDLKSAFDSPPATIEAMESYLASNSIGGLNLSEFSPSQGVIDAITQLPHFKEWLTHAVELPASLSHALATSDQVSCRAVLAESSRTTSRMLAVLAFDRENVIRRLVAYNRCADLPTLAWLADDGNDGVRTIARDSIRKRFGFEPRRVSQLRALVRAQLEPITTAGEFAETTTSLDVSDRIRARFASVAASTRSIRDLGPEVRWDRCCNLTVNSETAALELGKLLGRRVSRARWIARMERTLPVAGRPDLPVRLAADERQNLRMLAATNLLTPPLILGGLTQDPNDDVAREARRSLESARRQWSYRATFGDVWRFRTVNAVLDAGDQIDTDPFEFAINSATSRVWKDALLRRPDLAKWVAINETVGPRLLDELADWADPEVRGWVADHQRVWIKTLIRLANDPDPDVRRYATYNAKMPDAQLRKLARDSETTTREEAKRRLEVRAFADRLLQDPEWWRYLGNSPF